MVALVWKGLMIWRAGLDSAAAAEGKFTDHPRAAQMQSGTANGLRQERLFIYKIILLSVSCRAEKIFSAQRAGLKARMLGSTAEFVAE